jgi:hypothetical protein
MRLCESVLFLVVKQEKIVCKKVNKAAGTTEHTQVVGEL